MNVKLVAVDMDGTFLSKGDDYNRDRFAKIYAWMKKRGILFVVASGNQYYQISSFFDDESILYAAENGAWIKQGEQELYCAEMEFSKVLEIVDVLRSFEDVKLCVCGKRSAYVNDEQLLPLMRVCFPIIELRADFHTIKDIIFKIALVTPEEKTDAILKNIEAILPAQMEAVHCGFGCIDINIKGCHKGMALRRICEQNHIDVAECMAFGDSGNDIEMLRLAGYSYAMANACMDVKAVAKEEALSCEEEGVLHILEKMMQEEEKW